MTTTPEPRVDSVATGPTTKTKSATTKVAEMSPVEWLEEFYDEDMALEVGNWGGEESGMLCWAARGIDNYSANQENRNRGQGGGGLMFQLKTDTTEWDDMYCREITRGFWSTEDLRDRVGKRHP